MLRDGTTTLMHVLTKQFLHTFDLTALTVGEMVNVTSAVGCYTVPQIMVTSSF